MLGSDISYMADFDRCLNLVNRSKEIEKDMQNMIGKPGAFLYIMILQEQKEVTKNSIEAIYTKYNNQTNECHL